MSDPNKTESSASRPEPILDLTDDFNVVSFFEKNEFQKSESSLSDFGLDSSSKRGYIARLSLLQQESEDIFNMLDKEHVKQESYESSSSPSPSVYGNRFSFPEAYFSSSSSPNLLELNTESGPIKIKRMTSVSPSYDQSPIVPPATLLKRQLSTSDIPSVWPDTPNLENRKLPDIPTLPKTARESSSGDELFTGASTNKLRSDSLNFATNHDADRSHLWRERSKSVLTQVHIKKTKKKGSRIFSPSDHSNDYFLNVPDEKLCSVKARWFPAYYNDLCNSNSEEAFNRLWGQLDSEIYKDRSLYPNSSLLNRYNDIVPYKETRVKLHVYKDSSLTDYINASYVRIYKKNIQKYISCQAPLPQTVVDFWRMVWQEKMDLIVMLTDLNENGQKKCHKYWPTDCPATHVYMTITPVSTQENGFCYIRQFQISNDREPEESERTVTQLQYKHWPDYGVPSNPSVFISFYKYFKTFQLNALKGTTLVHCSAGIGRSGAFCAIDAAITRTAREGLINIYDIVYQMRCCRKGMVQTVEQFKFCYQILAIVTLNKNTSILPASKKNLNNLRKILSKRKISEK